MDIGTIALFLFGTGARITEATSVRWADVDFKKCTVLIRKSKLRNERTAHIPNNLFVALANLPRDRLTQARRRMRSKQGNNHEADLVLSIPLEKSAALCRL